MGQNCTRPDVGATRQNINTPIDRVKAMKENPTPKRKEAQAKRKQDLKISANGKVAKKAVRERARKQRVEAREAMLRGEEWAMPIRDRGPVRKRVRFIIDSRRSVGELFLPIAVVVLMFSLIPIAQIQQFVYVVWVALMFATILDEFIIYFKLKKTLRQEFPVEKERKGATSYGVLRALQMRSLRLPPPAIKVGGKPKV